MLAPTRGPQCPQSALRFADARAAVALLAAQPGIARVFLLGHSLGAMLAPRIAQGDARIAGLILMAGPTRPLAQVVVDQFKYLASLPGADAPVLRQELQSAQLAEREADSPALRPSQTVDLAGSPVPAAYLLDLRGYHPATVAATLHLPLLVLQGARDYQVTAPDYEGWQRALAHDPLASFHLYPGLDHLFMPSSSPGASLGTPADYAHPAHVAPAVVADIAACLHAPATAAH